MRYAIIALLLIPGATNANAADQAFAVSEDATESATVICRDTRKTGSRIPRSRRCLTKQQWAERDQRAWQKGAAMSSSPSMIGSLPTPVR